MTFSKKMLFKYNSRGQNNSDINTSASVTFGKRHSGQGSTERESYKKEKRSTPLAKNTEKLRRHKETHEGETSKSNCRYIADSLSITKPAEISSDYQVVYFDLETAGLSFNDSILQIAAKFDDTEFSVYVMPTTKISDDARRITGLHVKNGKLYRHDKKLLTHTLEDALIAFKDFLISTKKPVLLVAHNAGFDATRLVKNITEADMQNEFNNITGFADSLALFKKAFPGRKGPGMFKLSTLANDILHIAENVELFHDALYDVQILQKLIREINKEHGLGDYKRSYQYYLSQDKERNYINFHLRSFKSIVSKGVLTKMAKANLKDIDMIKMYDREGENAIMELFSEKLDNGKPRISNNQRVLFKIIHHLNEFSYLKMDSSF